MKKIIHLSDLHIGFEDSKARFERIVEDISHRMIPASEYVIVITGDLVDKASHEDQRHDSAQLLDRLRAQGYDVLVAPGNHDYGNGGIADKKYVPLFKQAYFKDEQVSYPKVDEIEGVIFIGLDSMAAELHWYDRMFADGELGKNQRLALKQIVDDAKYAGKPKVVYLHHHPITWMPGFELKDAEELNAIIAGKVDALLCGHMHKNSQKDCDNFNGTWNIPRVYNAGSTTHKDGHRGLHRVIDLSKESGADFNAEFRVHA